MKMIDISELADKYVTYSSLDEDKKEQHLYEESIFILQEMVNNEPETAGNVIVEIIKRTDNKWVLTLLGCGELESLLGRHFDQFIDRSEKEARGDKKFAFVVSCVWQNRMSDEQYARLDRLVEELGLERE